MAASSLLMNTSVSLQDESLMLLMLLDPASLYPLMIQVKEVADGGDDYVAEEQIFALVRHPLVVVVA